MAEARSLVVNDLTTPGYGRVGAGNLDNLTATL